METDLPVVNDLRQLFLNDIPLLDVRAPIEFEQGGFPTAINHPLIDNEERHEIGKTYKDAGQDAAVELGISLVSGDKKTSRIQQWQDFSEQNPEGVLYCFRGGLRSKTSQQWLFEKTGIAYPRVDGGYKRMRNFLIDEIEASAKEINPLVIGGRTGCGKTVFLKTIDNMIDLEGLAWHRGSAFGHHATPQPTQIDYENSLSIVLMKHRHSGNALLAVEDEGRHIGSVHMPKPLYEKFNSSPIAILEATVEERIAITLDEYIYQALAEYQDQYGEEKGFQEWRTYLLSSVDRIKRRLGDVRHAELHGLVAQCINTQEKTNETQQHADWIKILLVDYYDPMYDYQIQQKADRIVFKGTQEELKDYISRKS